MKKTIISFLFCTVCLLSLNAQTLPEAREWYLQGQFAKALPVFEQEYNAKPTDAAINQWYGVCLFETGGDLHKAEECILFASKKGIQDSFLYLGKLYTQQYRFDEAETAFVSFEEIINKKTPKRKKEDAEKDKIALEKIETEKAVTTRLHRMVANVEDIQVIDSLIVDKEQFLSAYKLSLSGGKLKNFDQVFSTNRPVQSTVFFNEKETKIYYAQPDSSNVYSLFSMEKIIDNFSNEKKLSPSNFGLSGDINYPYIMPDGVTVYFAAKDEESIGGYDLFVTRYNINNDTYLSPERMNMPFNSVYNDYMMVVDEEKMVGWFASDRFQPEGKVCVYTFIPNESVRIVENTDEAYKARRALITSIKDTWKEKTGYTELVETARKEPVQKEERLKDFEFVINDSHTYYLLGDFTNAEARDLYFRVVQMKKEADAGDKDLNKKREAYSKSADNEKRNMSDAILSLEKRMENLHKEIEKLEIEARNKEVGQLK